MLTRLSGALALVLFTAAAPAAAPAGEGGSDDAVLLRLLDEAAVHGLADPGDEAIRAGLSNPADRAVAATALGSRVVAYARAQHGGRVRPPQLDHRWALEPDRFDAEAEFAAAQSAGRLSEWASGLAPSHSGYRRLVNLRPRYQRAAASGGWPALTTAVAPGARGAAVESLRARLAMEGYAGDASEGAEFGPSLAAAVHAFQAAHGLATDGVVGPETLAALNVPAEARLAQIDLALERWRWLPRTMPSRRVEVNVAAAEAVLIEDDREFLRMRIVVGDLAHKTPLFRSAIHSAVFNPPWNVPGSIAAGEILPRARRDPGYLARNGFRYVNGQLQQAPGPGNALGRLKFDFDSPFGVYLHDTPGKAAFQRSRRTLSHGCMRLEKPRELAALLLGWSAGDVEAAIKAGTTRRVRLARPTPLFVVYQTAWAQPDGRVAFRPDVYGWDAKLGDALAGRAKVAHREPAMESECALAATFG